MGGMKEFTFFWFIEKYSYCWHKNRQVLISPSFTTFGLERIDWNLQLYPRGSTNERKGYISLFLCRSERDDGPKYVSIKWEMSFLAADGSPLESAQHQYTFEKETAYGNRKFLNLRDLFSQKTEYLPQDILTVCCKIWKGEGDVQNVGQCTARSRIKIEKISYLHVAKRFSIFPPNVKQTIQIPFHSRDKSFIFSTLYYTDGLCCREKIMIEIEPHFDQILCQCKISWVDGFGNVIECGKADCRYDTKGKIIRALPLSLLPCDYLLEGNLTLLCECTFSSGLEFHTIEETVREMPLAVKQVIDQAPRKRFTCFSLMEDMKHLYISKSLTDVQLRTKTKSFSVHKSVLCARSPVFKAMLTSELKEKDTDCIEVDDLGDDTLQQLLFFLYSDSVENLEWEIASQLYYATDKYQVGQLKIVCSSFLLENLTPTNAGELLLLADTQGDTDLKKSVEDFILEHEEQVFSSNEWEILIERNPLLFVKAMHLKYKKRKMN